MQNERDDLLTRSMTNGHGHGGGGTSSSSDLFTLGEQSGGPRDTEEITDLEQEVLDEYERLNGNMRKVKLSLPTSPSPEILHFFGKFFF